MFLVLASRTPEFPPFAILRIQVKCISAHSTVVIADCVPSQRQEIEIECMRERDQHSLLSEFGEYPDISNAAPVPFYFLQTARPLVIITSARWGLSGPALSSLTVRLRTRTSTREAVSLPQCSETKKRTEKWRMRGSRGRWLLISRTRLASYRIGSEPWFRSLRARGSSDVGPNPHVCTTGHLRRRWGSSGGRGLGLGRREWLLEMKSFP